MATLIVGGGKLGSNLATMLAEENRDVVVVEIDGDRVQMLHETRPDLHVVHGDGCEPGALEAAGVDDCDTVIAVTGDDEDNLVVCLLGKRQYGAGLTVARVNDPRNEWLFAERFGVDIAVSDTRLIAQMLTEDVSFGHLVTLFALKRDGLSVVELTLPEHTPASGTPLVDLALPPSAILIAVLRNGEALLPKASMRLEPGDEILAIAEDSYRAELERALMGESRP